MQVYNRYRQSPEIPCRPRPFIYECWPFARVFRSAEPGTTLAVCRYFNRVTRTARNIMWHDLPEGSSRLRISSRYRVELISEDQYDSCVAHMLFYEVMAGGGAVVSGEPL